MTAATSQITLRLTWRYCVALYCVTMLWASLHELAHHFAGYFACGAWGDKSFNSFSTACEGTTGSWMATYAGPAFSFVAMWIGWWLLVRGRSTVAQRHLGFATIFAQLPAQRLYGPLGRFNDEYYAASHMFGQTSTVMWVVFLIILGCTLPPLVGAWRSIANRQRLGWFLLYFLLLPYILFGPVFFVLEHLLVQRHILDGRTIGIANLFVLNEVITLALYVAVRRWIDPDR